VTTEVFTRGTPSAAGIDARGISAFLDALEADPGIRPHGLVLLRRGIVAAEGWWAPYSRDRVQLLYSLSKSFTVTAVGLAREEGLLDLDATVLSYFPELDADIVDPRSRAMRVRDLAAMASGHANDTIESALARDPENLVRGFLLLPPDADPGTLFAYNQPCTYTLATIVQRVTGLGLLDYLRPRLLEPLGITDTGWIEAPPGQALGFSGLHATTEAVARLGELYRRRGLWGDRRILDEEWVTLATSRHIATPVVGGPDWEQGYGYQFWMARHGYRGDGAFGQYCVVVPEHELVVAITSETPDMQRVLDALWATVLPALDRPSSAADEAALAERLHALAFPALGSAQGATATWQERRLDVSRSAGAVTGVRASFSGPEEGRLILVDGAGELALRVGDGHWVVQEVDGLPLAASGGLDADGGFTVEVLLLETPHTLRVRGDAAGRTVEVAWLTTPLHDQSVRAQRRP
jgi:CubicO group peptidase (beta-lactamase class C family)